MLQSLGKFWRHISSGPRDHQALTFLRISIGLFYLYVGNQKLNDPHFEAWLAHTLKGWAAGNPFPLYQQFLTHVILPHIHHVSLLVTDGELAIGLSYVLGLLIPISAPFAVLLNANYLLASQQTGFAVLGINLAFMLIAMTLFWGRAGRYFGLDGLFSRKTASTEKTVFGKSSKKLKTTQEGLSRAKSKAKPKSKPF